MTDTNFEIPKIELKMSGKKAPPFKLALILLAILLTSGFGVFSRQEKKIKEDSNKRKKVIFYKKEILGEKTAFLLTPTITIKEIKPTLVNKPTEVILPEEKKKISPSPTTFISFLPTPTFFAQPTQNPQNDNVIPLVSPLPPASEKKELLVLNFDSQVLGGWQVIKEENVNKVAGKTGDALFISQGKYLLFGGENFANAGTLSFWIKIKPLTEEGLEYPLIIWNFNGQDKLSAFEVSYIFPQLLFIIYDNEGEQNSLEVNLANDSLWHKIDIVWDFTKNPLMRQVYIDNQKVIQEPFYFSPLTCPSPYFQIGGGLWERQKAEFLIDEIKLTNWAKTEEELKKE